MKSKLLLFALLLMGVSAGAQIVSVSISNDCSKNGQTINVEPDGGAAVLETAGRIFCEYVQLWEGGPKWATFNVGATITDYANLTVGADATSYNNYQDQALYYNTANCGGLYAWKQPNYNARQTTWTSSVSTGAADVATTLWGSNWKTPTRQQLDTLQNSSYGKTTWTWCDGSSMQYVPGCTLKGYKVSGVGAYAYKSIFLPATGIFHLGSIADPSFRGSYWSSSTRSSGIDAHFMHFDPSNLFMSYTYCNEGLPVRAVLVETEPALDVYTLIIRSQGCSTQQTVIAHEGTVLSITSTPMTGYHFTQWSDGNTENPRTILLTQDTSFVAEFAKNPDEIGNVITYTATAKLSEVSSIYSSGLHTNAFNVSISSHSFSNGTGTITFSGEVTSIGNYAFRYSSGLTSVTIPNSVSSIGEAAFGDCYDLTSITIPNSVMSIGNWVFAECHSLTSITIGNSLTSIGHHTFYNCTNLTSVTIPNSVTSIEDSAFEDCSGLTSITIPNSVTSIGNYAFEYCSGLTSITIPNSVTSIGEDAFRECSGLTSVTIGNSVTSIGEDAFEGCSNLKTVYNLSILDFEKWSWDYGFVAYYADNVYNLRTFSVASSDTLFGTVSVSLDGHVIPNDTTLWTGTNLTLLATPNEHCQFSRWNDGNTNNPRTITTSKNETYIAYFELETHVINLSTSSNGGKVLGKTSGKYLDTISIEAAPDYGYHFTQWSDGVTDNPRSFVLTKDTAFVAAFERNSYSVATTPSDSTMGMTSGDTTALYQDNVTILAIPNYGYHFSQWNDRNWSNPRLITVTKDETYTAYFEPNTYVINLSTSSNGGKVSGQTSGKYLDTISIEATPDLGYHFTQWNDGNTENPRKFVLTQDTAFAAAFAITYSGSCGNDIDWKYSDGILTISGYGAMYDYSSNTVPWLLYRDSITSLTISENITSIGDYAFYGLQHRAFNQLILPQTVVTIGTYAFAECNRLTNICFGQNLEEIEDYAFYNCARINEMTIYATNAPDIYQNTFAYVSHYAYLFVPCESLRAYQIAAYWNAFDIKCIGADSNVTPLDDVVVTPSENSVNIVWPKDDAADTYTIVITKDGTTICTLTFNANGQLTNIAFAPSRSGESPARVAESINGSWSFTVTSLDPATTYAYAVTTKNAAQSVLNTYTGSFTTTGGAPITTSINAVNTGVDTPTKFLRDGQLLIQRDGKTYNMQGAQVK